MTDALKAIHETLANMVTYYSLLVGIWGLFNFLRRRPPDGNFNGSLAIGVGLFVLEGILGVVLVLLGKQPAQWLHVLYGVTILVTIPAIFAFTRGSNTARESMLYGFGMLFIFGLSLRAAYTAQFAH